MSISIHIHSINDLSDTERAVLRVIAGEMITATVADTLKATVRGIATATEDDNSPSELDIDPTTHPSYVAVGDKVMIDGVEPHGNINDAVIRLYGVAESAPAPVATVPTPPAAPANPNLDAAGLPWDKRIHSSSRAKVADGTWRYARNLDKALIATVEAELRAVQAIPVPVATSTNPPGWPFTEATTANTFATHGSPELDADAAKLEALAGAGAAGPTVADLANAMSPEQVTVESDGDRLTVSVADGANPETMESDTVPANVAAIFADVASTRGAAPIVPLPPVGAAIPGFSRVYDQYGREIVPPTAADAALSAAPPAPLPPAGTPLTFAQLMQHVTPLLVSGKLTQPMLQQAVEKCGLPYLAALGARPDLVETVKAAIDEAVGGVQ